MAAILHDVYNVIDLFKNQPFIEGYLPSEENKLGVILYHRFTATISYTKDTSGSNYVFEILSRTCAIAFREHSSSPFVFKTSSSKTQKNNATITIIKHSYNEQKGCVSPKFLATLKKFAPKYLEYVNAGWTIAPKPASEYGLPPLSWREYLEQLVFRIQPIYEARIKIEADLIVKNHALILQALAQKASISIHAETHTTKDDQRETILVGTHHALTAFFDFIRAQYTFKKR